MQLKASSANNARSEMYKGNVKRHRTVLTIMCRKPSTLSRGLIEGTQELDPRDLRLPIDTQLTVTQRKSNRASGSE